MKRTQPVEPKTNALSNYLIQIILTVWLALIAIQFFISYVLGWQEVDFKAAYIVMLCITIGAGIRSALQTLLPHLGKRK